MASRSTKVKDYRALVENVEIAWIPMRDGRKLAARLLLPREAAAKPVPAILEYIPYRRRDGTRPRDDDTHYWFAANGYGSARVDIAGSGDSDGLIGDEYVKREQDDAVEIIAWLAEQPWCTGAVGMIGISWGGFNGLQVAARRPPALKAVISLCSTVDRYHDDVHFMGGCLLNDTLDWGGYFFGIGALPPDPAIVGEDRWRQMWKKRIDGLDCYPALWMEHQCRDAFWKHGSVAENYGAIQCPVLVASGWVDGYTAAVFRLVENLKAPCKGIAGPWGHKYPHMGVPGPAIGFLQEAKRWWDRWLKGIDTGVEDDPALRLYVQDSALPKPHHDARSGRWIGLPTWPNPRIKTLRLHLAGGALAKSKPRAAGPPLTISSPQVAGLAAGEWCAYGLGKIAPELALDQRQDDALSLVFDGPVLDAPVTIVGRSIARLRIAVDRPQAHVCVRLNAIHPNGAVERITYGLLNLSHRDSHEKPTRLEKGRFYDVAVALNEIAQNVPRGCRLRLAISTAYWPMTWPDPRAVTARVDPEGSSLEVPILASEDGLTKVRFEAPEAAPTAPLTIKRPGKESRQVVHDIDSGRVDFVIARDDGAYVIDDIGTEVALTKTKTMSIVGDDPTSAVTTVATTVHYRRGTWDAHVAGTVRMTCDKDQFHIEASLEASEGGKPFGKRGFRRSLGRDHQ